MNRLALLAIVACSGCDIVGNIPADVPASVDMFQGICTGTKPHFSLSIAVDATIGPTDELGLSWSVTSNVSSNLPFRPTLDCGWWTWSFTYDDRQETGLGTATASEIPRGAACLRGNGPPRQIVTLSGAASSGTSSNDSVFANFTAESVEDSSAASGQSPRCAN